MPVILVWLGSLLATMAGELAVRALVGTGVGLATYAGTTLALDAAKSTIAGRFNALGVLAGYVGFLRIDQAITIIFSAWAGRTAVSAGKAFLVKRRGN